jgi:putative ABC transport system ATP-binding protein
MLELDHARRYYKAPAGEVHAVQDVSLTVSAGEFVAIFGPSGSGKTTLLSLAAGLLQVDAGSVRFEGRDLAKLTKPDVFAHRRFKLGFVYQAFNLTPGLTAEENVAVPLLVRGVSHRDARQRARAALDAVGLAQRSRHIPLELSGGEQQRVAIARALVGLPKLLLADEPTGNLDSETGDAILELLVTLPREHGAAVMLATHDTRVADYADRVLMIRDGRVTEPDLQAPASVE